LVWTCMSCFSYCMQTSICPQGWRPR